MWVPMPPLDRILESFPGSRELLLRLDEYLPLIVVGSIVLLIALVVYWTFVAAPRRAVRIIGGSRWLAHGTAAGRAGISR
jgi:hypothetical protein